MSTILPPGSLLLVFRSRRTKFIVHASVLLSAACVSNRALGMAVKATMDPQQVLERLSAAHAPAQLSCREDKMSEIRKELQKSIKSQRVHGPLPTNIPA